MAWGLKTFGSTAWGFGDISTAVTSTGAIASHAVGNETVVEGTGVTFGVTSTDAAASHLVGTVSITEGQGVSFGVNSADAFATGFVGEEIIWFDIPTNTVDAAGWVEIYSI